MNQEDEYETETEKERKIKALLNLEEIEVTLTDGYSSSGCSGRCLFLIKCSGRHGYTEDPDFEDVLFEVLDTKRKGDDVILKIKAKIQEEQE